jgi:penicillin-binding protein 1A
MMGIKSKLNGYCAESLGGLEDGVSPLEMASAYSTIANGGSRNRPRVIRKVRTAEGRLELPRRWRVHRAKAFSDGVTYEATKILEANIRGGTGTHAAIPCPAGGKTGTTDKNIDAWFVGFTPRLSTAVWVGFPGSAQVSMNGMYRPTGGNIDGGTYPADIWHDYMAKAIGKYCGDFKPPREPFQSQPFFGHYSRSGAKELGGEDGSSTGTTTTPPTTTAPPAADQPAPDTTTDDNNGGGGNGTPPTGDNNGAAFDPNQYETPPQPEPQTQTPQGGTQGGGTQAPGNG